MTKLAAFPRLDHLVELAGAGADIRPALLAALTEIYVQRPSHSQEEDQQFCELVQRLVTDVDRPTRAAVAAKLIAYPAKPAVLLDILARHARPEPDLADPQTATAGELAAWFAAAGSEERRLILLILDLAGEGVAAATGAMAPDAVRGLESLAMQRRTDAFATHLARLLDVADAHGRWIVEDAGGEPIVVAAKFIGVPVDLPQRLLLLLNPAISHSVPRVYALVRLYEQITISAAAQLVSIWCEAKPRRLPSTAHVPVHWPDPLEGGRHRPLRAPSPARARNQTAQPIVKSEKS